VTVWRDQDWAWRFAAIVGLLGALVGPLWISAATESGRLAAAATMVIISHWLLLMRWSLAGVLWVVLSGVPLLVLLSCVACSGGDPWRWLAIASYTPMALDLLPEGIDRLWLGLGPAAVVSAQVWIGWEASVTLRSASAAASDLGSDKAAQSGQGAGRSWQILAWLGLSAGLLGVVVGMVCWTREASALGKLDYFGIVYWSYARLLAVAGVLVAVVWRSLMLRGRGWLFWLLMWTVPVAGYLAMVIGGQTEPVSGALGGAYLLVAATQVWVALKARQLQSGQVGLVTH